MPDSTELLEFNTALYVNPKGSVLDIPELNDSIDRVAPFIGRWYGAGTKETPEQSMEIDFGGSNMAAVTFDGDGVVGYLSGQLFETDGLFGNDLTQVFRTYGFVVNPDYRGMGIGGVLFENILGQCDAFYGDTRNFSVVRIAAKLAQERGDYLQFGFQRYIPDWAVQHKHEFQQLIRSLWYENLKSGAGSDGYQIPEKHSKRLCYSAEYAYGLWPQYTYAPEWITTGEQPIKEGELFNEMFEFLNQYPDLYSPMLYVKRPCLPIFLF